MTRIRFAGLEARLDRDRFWVPTQTNGKRPADVRRLLAFLNQSYGPEWEPDFGVYEPSWANASAQALAIDVGAEILELDPIEDVPGGVAI